MEKNILYRPTVPDRPPSLTDLAVNPKGNRIVCGTTDARIIILNSKTGKPIRAMDGHQSIISALTFILGGTQILSTSWDNTVRSWSSTNGSQKESVLTHSTEIKAVAVDSESSKGVAGTRDGLMKVFSVESMKCIRNVPAHTKDISAITFTSDGTRLLTASWDGSVKLWDLSTYEILKNILRQKERIRAMVLSPNDSRVYLGLHNGVIKSVSLDNSRDRTDLDGHTDIVSAMAIDHTGTLLASGSWDRTLRIWNIEDGKHIHTQKLGTGISALGWNPKSNVLYSTDFSGSLLSWEFASNSPAV